MSKFIFESFSLSCSDLQKSSITFSDSDYSNSMLCPLLKSWLNIYSSLACGLTFFIYSSIINLWSSSVLLLINSILSSNSLKNIHNSNTSSVYIKFSEIKQVPFLPHFLPKELRVIKYLLLFIIFYPIIKRQCGRPSLIP